MNLPNSSDRGAALLLTLVIVAIMSMVALAATDSLARATLLAKTTDARATNGWSQHAVQIIGAAAVEEIIAGTKGTLVEGHPGLDEPQTLSVPRGVVTAEVSEATNCFNLNALTTGEKGQAQVINKEALKSYERLLIAAGLYESDARQLADSLADWIDADNEPRPFGAEDVVYRAAKVPHRTANRKLINISELNVIHGYTPERQILLRPLVCLRPGKAQVPLNVNTLTPQQAPLLTALYSSTLSAEDAEDLIESRPAGGWFNVDELKSESAILAISQGGRDDTMLGVQSKYFKVRGLLQTGPISTPFRHIYEIDAQGRATLTNAFSGGA
jgi:general secretion pathway protein K